MLNGSWSEANFLLNRDRDFFTRGMEHVLARNPDFFGLTLRPSTTPNIRSTTGVDLILDDGTRLNSPITYLPKGYLGPDSDGRSEEHTSELQSLMRISYAVFCLKKKKKKTIYIQPKD